MITIEIKDLFKVNKLRKVSNGTNIFNLMLKGYKNNPKAEGFSLNMQGITTVAPIVFLTIVNQMKTKFDGDFKLELVNATPLIKQTFKMVVG